MIQRIEICGNIASGKTTLTRGLADCGIEITIEEKYLENPFIGRFYENPSFFSFETEITFLLQHYHAIKTSKQHSRIVCDYSLTLDKAYADVTLAPVRRDIFLSIAAELEQEVGQPTMVIYLKCPEDVLLTRIRERNRSFEASIDVGYLKALSDAIAARMAELPSSIKVITINSNETNFVSGVEGVAPLVEVCNI